MWYYITVDGVCRYIASTTKDANDWLKKHNKGIKEIYIKRDNETIIEVK